MSFTAIILAGGFGTRLRPVVRDLPKPMAPIRNRPFLDYQLIWLQRYGCRKAVLCTGHLADSVSSHYGKVFKGVELNYSEEKEPLGTGGAIKKALQNISQGEILVLNGDSLFDIDLGEFRRLHAQKRSACSIALRRVENASRYGSIETNSDSRITAFREKSNTQKAGQINGGIYLLDRNTFLAEAPAEERFSIERDFFSTRCNTLHMFGFLFDEYFIDIGVPEDYARAQDEFERFEDR